MAVSVSLISLCICSATARRAAPSSRSRRCRAERTSDQALYSRHGEVQVDGKRRAQMFDHPIAFVGLGLQQKLIDDGSGVSLLAQAGSGLMQGLGPVRFLAGGGV